MWWLWFLCICRKDITLCYHISKHKPGALNTYLDIAPCLPGFKTPFQVTSKQQEFDSRFGVVRKTVVLLNKYNFKMEKEEFFLAAPSRWLADSYRPGIRDGECEFIKRNPLKLRDSLESLGNPSFAHTAHYRKMMLCSILAGVTN